MSKKFLAYSCPYLKKIIDRIENMIEAILISLIFLLVI